MSIRNNSAKILRKPSSQNRGSSLSRLQNPSTSPNPRSAKTSSSVANRLIQKRASTDRKLEMLRQKKLEAEMKEMQSKPKILDKSRAIARRAEKKVLGQDLQIEFGEENLERLKKTAQSQNRIKSCKTKYDHSQVFQEFTQKRLVSDLKGKTEVKSQGFKKNPRVETQRTEFFPLQTCDDTFEIEEEIGMIESKLGIQKKSFDLRKEDDHKNFVFSPNPRVNQRLNFKHKFRVRD